MSKFKVTKEPFYFAGKEYSKGDVLELPDHFLKGGVYGVTPVGKSAPLKTTYISKDDVQEVETPESEEEVEVIESDEVEEEVETPKASKSKGKNKK